MVGGVCTTSHPTRRGQAPVADPHPLAGAADMYGGFIVDPSRLPAAPARFTEVLACSIAAWRAAGYRLVWLKIPRRSAPLVPVAAAAGFSFHHAGPDHLTMTLPLQPHAHIPHYATHNVGAGGVVIDALDRLLVVSERFRPDLTRPYYKLPGGSLDPEEDLATAVVREVAEETGIRAEFQGIVCIRHRHQFRFGRSDLYIVCRLRPLIADIRHDPAEIEECRWMPLAEYFASAHVARFNRTIVRLAMRGPALAPVAIEDHQTYEFLAPAAGDGEPAPPAAAGVQPAAAVAEAHG